jgi:HTH-type transcriptional regulator/antitoxin HigA
MKTSKLGLLKTQEDYERALSRLLALNEPDPGTPEGDEFELLLLLIEHYESLHIEELPPPHPVAAIAFRMEQLGLRPSAFGQLINSASHASEILRLQRPLSLKHIRILHQNWNIPPEILIQPYAIQEPQPKYKRKGEP